MKLTCCVDDKMNHHEMKVTVHSKNKKLAEMLIEQFKEKLGEIEVLDEFKNVYPISLLSIYYFELVDHKIFAYTENDVFGMPNMAFGTLKETIKSFGFYQVNVRTLVNVKHVEKYQKEIGCRRRMILDNGDVLISSRRFYKEFDKMVEDRRHIDTKNKYY